MGLCSCCSEGCTLKQQPQHSELYISYSTVLPQSSISPACLLPASHMLGQVKRGNVCCSLSHGSVQSATGCIPPPPEIVQHANSEPSAAAYRRCARKSIQLSPPASYCSSSQLPHPSTSSSSVAHRRQAGKQQYNAHTRHTSVVY